MSELLDFYKQQAQEGMSTIPWLAALQAKGLQELARFGGFPSRHDEEWKYTSVDTFLQQPFTKLLRPSTSATSSISSDMPVSRQLIIQNGQVLGAELLAKQLPAGVLILPLTQALEQQADKIRPYLGQFLRHEHGFQALNTAMLAEGVFVYLPAGVCVEEPILLSHWQDQAGQAVYSRHLMIAEAGSQATLIEEYRGEAGCNYFTNTVTEVVTAREASLVHYKIQRESKSAYHMGHLAVRLANNSQFDSHSLSLGGKLVRSDMSLYLQEENAGCFLNGIYAPAEGQHIDHHTTVYHEVPNCQSEQNYKGILTGRSRAVFNGKVIVAKGAQHTQARQQNKNLLLSAQAEINSKPQLDIFADDVVCTHGATVGQLDEEALFYLATRGIDRCEASHYLVQAFIADNLRLLPHPLFADWMGTLLNQQLR